MEIVEVEIIGQVITARYGTLSTGDILRTDRAFAEHLIEDCKGAKWPEPKVAAEPVQVAVESPVEAVQSGALSTLQLAPLPTNAIAALETDDVANLSGVQIRAFTTDQVVALTTAGANALTIAHVSDQGAAAPAKEAVARLRPAMDASVSQSKPAAKQGKKALK